MWPVEVGEFERKGSFSCSLWNRADVSSAIESEPSAKRISPAQSSIVKFESVSASQRYE